MLHITCDDMSSLVQAMAWSRHATRSHFLSECWLRSITPYGVIRPQSARSKLYLFYYAPVMSLQIELFVQTIGTFVYVRLGRTIPTVVRWQIYHVWHHAQLLLVTKYTTIYSIVHNIRSIVSAIRPLDVSWRNSRNCDNITVTSLWARMRPKSPASLLFTQPFIQAQSKENIKAPRHWPLCGELTGDRRIPRANGQ